MVHHEHQPLEYSPLHGHSVKWFFQQSIQVLTFHVEIATSDKVVELILTMEDQGMAVWVTLVLWAWQTPWLKLTI